MSVRAEVQAFTSDVLTADAAIVSTLSQRQFDRKWALAYRDASDLLKDGQDFFEAPVATVGNIVGATPEGGKVNVYQISGSANQVKLGKLTAALEFPDEVTRFRRLGLALSTLDVFSDRVAAEFAAIHYGIFNTADRMAAVTSFNLLENRINTLDAALNTLCTRMAAKCSFDPGEIILYCPIEAFVGMSRAVKESGLQIDVLPVVATLTDPTLCLPGWFNWRAEITQETERKWMDSTIKTIAVYSGTLTDIDQFQRIEYAT